MRIKAKCAQFTKLRTILYSEATKLHSNRQKKYQLNFSYNKNCRKKRYSQNIVSSQSALNLSLHLT